MLCREWEIWALSPKWNVFIKPLPSYPNHLYRRRSRKIARSRGAGWLQESRVFQTHMHSKIRAAHTRPAQVQARQVHSPERRRRTQGYIPNQEGMCNWYTVLKEKYIFFSNWEIGYINHASEQALWNLLPTYVYDLNPWNYEATPFDECEQPLGFNHPTGRVWHHITLKTYNRGALARL